MLIGVSGKINSGKDLVGKIIQYLTSESNVYPFDLKLDYSYKSDWQIKKFADPLKDMVCILLGCTREQLENESFKSKELGEEWWYWYMELDGGYSPIILDYLTTTKKQLKNYEGLELIKPTPRFLLQFIGTNLLRNQLHPEIWINSTFADYKSYRPVKIITPLKKFELGENPEYPNWIITDTRFENELEAVKKRGGITIRVNRPCNICGGSGYHKMSCPVSKSGEHLSETSLDKAEFDYVVDNNSDIQSLIEKVRKILVTEKII